MVREPRKLIVIGASAGGIEAVKRLVARLPAHLDAAVAIVIHTGATSVSVLPDIIRGAGALPAIHAVHGGQLEAGVIYVAPPDQHLTVERGRTALNHGPKENRTRPAIDPLFRAAAKAYGHDAIGVILTGMLDDGTIGLAAIKRAGGIAIVQDPVEAAHAGMPQSAMTYVKDVDYCVALDDIALLLVKLVHPEVSTGAARRRGEDPSAVDDAPSGFTCPECHGALWETTVGGVVGYHCRVGHRYAPETLQEEEDIGVEAALYAALRALRESAAVELKLASRARTAEKHAAAERFEERALRRDQQADVIQAMLEQRRAH